MDALKDLEVWRKSCRLAVETYGILSQCTDRGFKDQLGRSALSIASNIAEGYERNSTKDRARYLSIAKGSCGEYWTQILIGIEAGLIDKDPARKTAREVQQISKMLHGLIKYLEKG